MNLKRMTTTMAAVAFVTSVAFSNSIFAAEKPGSTPMFDETAYTEYVEKNMEELNALYLQFCGTCGVSGAKAEQARKKYYVLARELMQGINARLDTLDPKKGAALSPTETLVNIHLLVMLVDMLTATQQENMAEHPYN